jgi:hypothetical protein
MKKIFFGILAFLLLMIVLFGIGEVCFRVFRKDTNSLADITQKAKTYLFAPNTTIHGTSEKDPDLNYTAKINKYGYRGKDFAMPKPKGLFRIFAVGDSFTAGVGAGENETIPFLIEEDLRPRYSNSEVINAGIGHASPISHLVNLKNIHLKYQPDMVILLFDLTDLWDDWHFERMAIFDKNGEIVRFDPMFRDGKRDWWITCTYYSAFCRYINTKVIRSIKKMKTLGLKEYARAVKEGKRAKAVISTSKDNVSDEDVIEYDGLLLMRGREKEALIRKHWERTTLYLTKIKELLDEKGIPLVIAMYPQGIYLEGNQWSKGRVTWGFEEGKVYKDYLPFELMKEFCSRENIPFINTLDDFLKAPVKKYFYDWDGHMTPAGYRIVAQSIASNKRFNDIVSAADKFQQ